MVWTCLATTNFCRWTALSSLSLNYTDQPLCAQCRRVKCAFLSTVSPVSEVSVPSFLNCVDKTLKVSSRHISVGTVTTLRAVKPSEQSWFDFDRSNNFPFSLPSRPPTPKKTLYVRISPPYVPQKFLTIQFPQSPVTPSPLSPNVFLSIVMQITQFPTGL